MGSRDHRPELNFSLGTDKPIPELVAPPARARAAQLAREDREASEHLEADRASKEYIANLRRANPEHV